MSDSDDAYAVAVGLIEQARVEGATMLNFDQPETRALTEIPPEIGGLDKLSILVLNNTQVSDLSPLAGLTGLKELLLANTPVGDLSPIGQLTGLTELTFSDTQVRDLSPIKGMKQLNGLRLRNTQVSDISPIAELSSLSELNLDYTQVTDLSPLTGLAAITQLSLTNTAVKDISPLASIKNIKSLFLAKTLVRDLSALSGLKDIERIDLDDTELNDISALRGLTNMTWLDIEDTDVSDISPITGWPKLKVLILGGSKVSDLKSLPMGAPISTLSCDLCPVNDLRPVTNFPSLLGPFGTGIWTRHRGISFKQSGATRADPRIAEIAEIEDDADRARVLFEYLKGWEVPGEVPPQPLEPDPLVRSLIVNGQLDIETDAPTAAELQDRVKRTLHERLRRLLPELAQLAGNHFPRLASRSRVLSDQVAGPFEELDLLTIHLEIEDLEDRREKGTEDGVPFSEEVATALKSVTNIGPGLTLDHPDVNIMLERRRRAREEAANQAEEAKRAELSQVIRKDPDANSPRSRDFEELLDRVADKAASQVLRKAKHKNLIHTLATVAAVVTAQVGYNVAATLIADAYGVSITTFVMTNWTLLAEVAATYGRGAAIWFQNTVGPLMGGIDTTALRPINRGKPTRPFTPS